MLERSASSPEIERDLPDQKTSCAEKTAMFHGVANLAEMFFNLSAKALGSHVKT